MSCFPHALAGSRRVTSAGSRRREGLLLQFEGVLDLLRAVLGGHLAGDDFDGYVIDDAADSGTESLVEHRASIEGEGTPVPGDLLRLSVGLEDAEDLYRDLAAALDTAHRN